ncbi:MAG: glycosyltransferase family 39 protein, partial [Candidatus Omnitrophica bacterium]|nr:glycosyltransferase family 39 protein [Candidatus Omnitrophota bacterium]
DSAWTAIVQFSLLEKDAANFPVPIHGTNYLFAYYLVLHFLLKFLPEASSNIMEYLNIINGFIFSLNIMLIYVFFRRLSFERTISLLLSLLYFFLPMAFQISLYVSPETFSFFFFLLTNIFFISYLESKKRKDLILIIFFFALSMVIRPDTFLLYFSFIALTVYYKKPLKITLALLFSCILIGLLAFVVLKLAIGGIFIQPKTILAETIWLLTNNMQFIKITLALIASSIGSGLILISTILAFYFLKTGNRRGFIPLALWFLPVAAIYLMLFTRHHVNRYIMGSYLGLIFFIGLGIKQISRKSLGKHLVCFSLILAVHFLGMDLQYQLVKNNYRFKRNYKYNETILIDHAPLGNIFNNALELRREKRMVWNAAKVLASTQDKVIIFSNSTDSPAYYYFLYRLYHKDLKGAEIDDTEMVFVAGNKEFVFVYVLPQYKKEKIFSLLNKQQLKDHKIYFSPFIAERVPELYSDIESFSKKNRRKMLKIPGEES